MRGHKNQWKQLQGLTPLKGRAGCNISLQRLDWSFGLCWSESLCPTMPSGPCLLCCYKIVNISWICYCTKTLVELLVCILRNKINTCVQDSQIWIPPPPSLLIYFGSTTYYRFCTSPCVKLYTFRNDLWNAILFPQTHREQYFVDLLFKPYMHIQIFVLYVTSILGIFFS